MKYVLISLAAITLFTGAASAQNDKAWPCVELKANWMKAPPKQCPQIYLEDRQHIQAAPQVETMKETEANTDL